MREKKRCSNKLFIVVTLCFLHYFVVIFFCACESYYTEAVPLSSFADDHCRRTRHNESHNHNEKESEETP